MFDTGPAAVNDEGSVVLVLMLSMADTHSPYSGLEGNILATA